MILPGILTLPGRIVGKVVNQGLGTLINSPIDRVGKIYLANYSRGQESEADRLGMQLSARSGYNPQELAVILGQLEKDVEMQTGQERKFSFFDSHPMTPKRIKEIHSGAEKLDWSRKPAIARNTRDFLNRLDGLYYGINPAQGVFHGQQFLQPDFNFSIRFPRAWQTVNTPSAVGAIVLLIVLL